MVTSLRKMRYRSSHIIGDQIITKVNKDSKNRSAQNCTLWTINYKIANQETKAGIVD